MIIHRGKQAILAGNCPVAFWECWCGARWLCPPMTHAYRWCPAAPVDVGTVLPPHVLSAVVIPAGAGDSPQSYAVDVRAGSVGTRFASVPTLDRALLVAHAIQMTFEDDARKLRWSW